MRAAVGLGLILGMLGAAPGDPLLEARQQRRQGAPLKALHTLQAAGLDRAKNGPALGVLAAVAMGAGEAALAQQALQRILAAPGLDGAARWSVEARLMQVCALPCAAPWRTPAQLRTAPLMVQANYLSGLTRVDGARAAALAGALLMNGNANAPDPSHGPQKESHSDEARATPSLAARAALLSAQYLALHGVKDPKAEDLGTQAWAQMPMEPAVAYLVRPMEEATMLRVHGVRLTVERLEAFAAAHENHEVVRLGKSLCGPAVVTAGGVCLALPRELGCRVAFEVGKAHRQVRQPELAEATLQAVAAACPQFSERARFLEARAAMAIKGAGPRAVETLLRLVAQHPTSHLADDALVMAAELLGRLQDEPGARTLLLRAEKEYSSSDMGPYASWRLAWRDALEKGPQAAQVRLTALAQQHQDESLARKARYWMARWSPETERALALQLLVERFPVTVEAALARGWLARMNAEIPPATLLGDAAQVPWPQRASQDLGAGRTLLNLGLEEDAAQHLTAALDNPSEELWAAQLLIQAGDAASASQRVRKGFAAALEERPLNARVWRLAYPVAFEEEIDAASKETHLPSPLLLALAREESALDARARSPSGALGLFQLLPATAVTEAMARKMEIHNELELMDPAVNTLLGAAYLERTVRQGHGNFAVGLAGYNAGPGNAAAWLGPVQEDVELDVFLERIPVAETREYVHRVLDSSAVYALLLQHRALVLGTRAREPSRW